MALKMCDESVQTSEILERKIRDRKMVEDGAQMWKTYLEAARWNKLQEQKEVRTMMEQYWPWGRQGDVKPRGLRNLRQDGLFPHRDFEQKVCFEFHAMKSKRFVGCLPLGKPGGGAPNVSPNGKQIIHTKEDPLLRFQNSNEMKKCVDTIRYKTSRQEQQEYRQELERQVAEKKMLLRKENMENQNKDRQLGYSNAFYAENDKNILRDNSKRKLPKRVLNPIVRSVNRRNMLSDNYITKGTNPINLRRSQLSPFLNGIENGVELAPLVVGKRGNLRIPRMTTDITKRAISTKLPKWHTQGPQYLQELHKQISLKRQWDETVRQQELAETRKHFTTLDSIWGRPGNGAPRSAVKKGNLGRMLYPSFITSVA